MKYPMVSAATVALALALTVELEADRDLAAWTIEHAAVPPRDVLVAGAELAPEVDGEPAAPTFVVVGVRERVAHRAADARGATVALHGLVRCRRPMR